MEALYGRPKKEKVLKFLIFKKRMIFFDRVFSSIFGHKSMDLDPDPDSTKSLDLVSMNLDPKHCLKG